MKEYLVEKKFECYGLPCVIILQKIGFRCGYVGIPISHKMYGCEYDDIDVNAHGGLTYSNKNLVETDGDFWWLGFDCGHYRDGIDIEAVVKSGMKTEAEAREISMMISGDIWSLDMVKDECNYLAKQLAEEE